MSNPSNLLLYLVHEIPNAARAEQAFFSTEPWSSLGLDPLGVEIENLRVFLQELLDSHIEREIPNVREELRELLERNCQDLAALGMERNTAGQIRIYLTQISADFHGLVRAGKDFANRLRVVVHLENDNFANHIREYGQTQKVVSREDDQTFVSNDQTIELSLNEEGQILVSKEGMAVWVKESMRWGKIAREHVDAVANLISTFLQAALKFVIKDIKVRENVQNCVEKSVQGNIKRAIDELNVLLEDEARQPITYNHYYTDNIQKARNGQSKHQIQDSMHNAIRTDWDGKFHVSSNSSDEIEKLVTSLQQRMVVDMTKQACSEAQNDLTAHYKVAMKTFVDNICRQVIERHIISKLPSIFEPVLVSGYETGVLLRMAAESVQVSIRRDEARHLREVLEKSLEDLNV
ncbi:uncharacterized protein KD926_003151 [Aspergillus affinis]|uniref:uncharacterized protein n=1 Tax=Aspergillus affinis TaxID=1070780 RepID=UPI0022FEE8FA|nr:uncharacterized protein KD926_003151 [Aspergillus affinis]KAI9035673.1 hypothetical protein KD926_003151 [Aspergillus affinis]